MSKIKRIVNYDLDDARCEEINIMREKLARNYENLIPQLERATGWDKVDIEEMMLSISEELWELSEEYESLKFCTIEFE